LHNESIARYAGEAGILLHIFGKFMILKLKFIINFCTELTIVVKLENEIHCLLGYPSTSTDRQVLIGMINNNCNNFQYLNLSDKFF
jgi:hypothetical protein